MALPASFDTITVTGRYVDFLGQPGSGTLLFEPVLDGWLKSIDTDTIIIPKPVPVSLQPDGTFSVDLPYSNDPEIIPTFTYRVTERVSGSTRAFNIELPILLTDPSVNLADLAPVGPYQTGTNVLTRELADLLYQPKGVGGGGGGTFDGTADDILETSLRVFVSPTQKAKLDGIAQGATANQTDTFLRARANHTGTQLFNTLSDGVESVQDIVGAMFSGGNVTTTYNDAAGTITVNVDGGGIADPELMRDTIGAALIGVGAISITINDAADTITIGTTATVNDTNAQLRDRSTHTGFQAISTITDLQAQLNAKQPLGGAVASAAGIPGGAPVGSMWVVLG